ncbi:MAG: DUF72 domain-containing protein [Crenarchaeota archaeon]|nr:DUF72 domain-containing protein [Thermoproteota archaeon]
MAKYYIGCSGWWYKDWIERFYPKEINEPERLRYYSQIFNTVEVNVTFYKLPPEVMIKLWVRKTPKDFIFSVKAPQESTHQMHFLYAHRKMMNFLNALAPLRSANKLGPILFQAPPEFVYTESTLKRLEEFLNNLPKDHEFAIEFRHRSWLNEKAFELLSSYNVAFVIVDGPLLQPILKVTTNDFAYVRFHGRGKKVWYYYDYKKEELQSWADRIRKELEPSVRKLYIYFNNHFRAFAPKNAREFIEIMDLQPTELKRQTIQSELSRFSILKRTDKHPI